MSFPAKVEMFSRHWDGIHPWKTLVIVDIKRMGPHHLFAIGPINHSGKNTWTASIFEFWIYVMNWWNSFIVDHYKCFQIFFTFSLLQGIVKWCLLLPMSYFRFQINQWVQMSRGAAEGRASFSQSWVVSLELGQQTTKSNGVPELFMVDPIIISHLWNNCECGHSQTDWIVTLASMSLFQVPQFVRNSQLCHSVTNH